MSTGPSQLTPADHLSAAETSEALRYLRETRDSVANAVRGLSEAQLKFKPSPDRWSASEIVEHLRIVEHLFLDYTIPRLNQAAAAEPHRDPQQADARMLAWARDSSTKYIAPERISPAGHTPLHDSLEHFLSARERTAAVLQSSPADLRRHFVDHPAYGPVDGYQWFLLIAAHTERHVRQIADLKAQPEFPVT